MSSVSGAVLGPLVNAIWDLRDHSYDHPDQWQHLRPLDVFQAMGEILDRAAETGEEFDWSQLPRLVQDALLRREPSA